MCSRSSATGNGGMWREKGGKCGEGNGENLLSQILPAPYCPATTQQFIPRVGVMCDENAVGGLDLTVWGFTG